MATPTHPFKKSAHQGNSPKRFFWTHYLIVFFVIAAGTIAIAIFSLISIINNSSKVDEYDTSSNISFDQATIDRIKNLSDDPTKDKFELPTDQRSDPFMER